jgi:hypothetical protein
VLRAADVATAHMPLDDVADAEFRGALPDLRTPGETA